MKTINNLFMLCILVAFISCNTKKEKEVQVSKKGVDKVETTTLSAGELAPETINSFEKKFGTHSGKRRNHITGFCFSGEITLKDPTIREYSRSPIFSEKPLQVMGRFSHKGGVKNDESIPGEYGMALEIQLGDGSIHNITMNTLDFFPVNTPEGFLKLMQAKVSGKAEDFDKLKQEHPEFKNFKAHYAKKPKQELTHYANHQFNSVNSFYFVNENDIKTPVRWSFIPINKKIGLDGEKGVDYYKETEKALTGNKTLSWEMVVTIANENDAINKAASIWTGNHKEIVAAVLTIDAVAMEGPCNDKNFDPLVLKDGIIPSDDPVLLFRSPTYAISTGRRLTEKHTKE
ncbi:hypothetical protein [Dokdonia sp.]|uniref:hypothetical protein n=1 Tax=Dokdonia sp. TaxID=2024995 RepID=UPI0032678048